MKFKPVKTAVIGCGRICNAYLNNLTKTFSIIDLVGCSDLMEYKSKEKAEKYGIRQMTNEEILSDPEIELVLNLTNPASHYEVSKQILEAGKHCYVELREAVEMPKSWQGNLHLAIAPTKNMDRIEWLAEKATEIGWDRVSFLNCRFSERKVIKTDRIERIVVSAMKQSLKFHKPA